MTAPLTAAVAGLLVCPICKRLNWPHGTGHDGACRRCGATLHLRKPNSINRTWALLITAFIMYIPANVLPIMLTSSLFGPQKDTIISGVIYLWGSGSWHIALVILIASVLVPLTKMLALTLLLVSVQRRWIGWRLERARLYRVVELIGRWSMIDVFVVAVLVALVQLGSLATVTAEPGAVAFGAVVILSMLAAEAFDPRLIWDAVEKNKRD